MPELEIHDVVLLKKLARQAERLLASSSHPVQQKAYARIAEGTNLLWRLLDQNGSGGKTILK